MVAIPYDVGVRTTFRLFGQRWQLEIRDEDRMDNLGKRKFHTNTLYGATYPRSRKIILRAGMSLMELVDTICHEVFHACYSYELPEELLATESGTCCATILRAFGLLVDA